MTCDPELGRGFDDCLYQYGLLNSKVQSTENVLVQIKLSLFITIVEVHSLPI